MDWLAQNWIWVVLLVLFIAVHLFGHGGHGAHSGHRGDTDATLRPEDRDQQDKTRTQGHQH